MTEKDIDRYQRIVAICRVGDQDLNGWLVEEGWALAFRKYSLDYVSAEDKARAARHLARPLRTAVGMARGAFAALASSQPAPCEMLQAPAR